MKRRAILSLVLATAACGDDGGNNPTPDSPPGPTCATATAGDITSYPGMFMGTTLGGGADLTAAEGACATQTEDAWFDPLGEDVIIHLGGLTPGASYVVKLTTADDLSFYVTSSCPPATGAVSECINFTDVRFVDETGAFVAAGTDHWLVIDASDDPGPPDTGSFTVEVDVAECTVETEMTACAMATPFCQDFGCVQCLSYFDCASGTPVCDAANTCVAGPMTCTGDDVRDTTAPGDDGPSAATMIAAPTVGTPTVVTGGICNSSADELDWFKVTLSGDLGVELEFTGATNDLDVYLLDAAGTVVESGESNAGINEAIRATGLANGTYYVVVSQFRPENTVAAVPYTLRLRVPDCTDDFGCLNAGAPVCGGAGVCGAGPAACVGDDAADGGTGDDGPAAARDLTAAVGTPAALTGSVCASPGEADYYKVTVAAGQGMTVELAWTGAAIDLDPTVLDATGRTLGFSFYLNPENVALTYLPAGTYYIRVNQFAQMASTTVTAYTITATRTAAQTCTTSTQCAAEYETQLFRGSCTAGVCQFIAPATPVANGMPCDSGNDCTSNRCSYIAFESDAQDSVCTATCTTTADCAAVGAGLTCTTGFQTNFCVPSCTADLECGANTGSATVDPGLPWNYLTCTAATGVCAP